MVFMKAERGKGPRQRRDRKTRFDPSRFFENQSTISLERGEIDT
jgi:hypothetical protein